MNIFYHDNGEFKCATITKQNDSNYHITSPHGKQLKIKANAVLINFTQDIQNFINIANLVKKTIDIELLWQIFENQEISAENMASEYFGENYEKTQLAAIYLAIYEAPIYFYKKDKKIFKTAPKENVDKALIAIEKKKQQQIIIDNWLNQLKNNQLPIEFNKEINRILFNPDYQNNKDKTFKTACDCLKISANELAFKLGLFKNLSDYLIAKFIYYNHQTNNKNINLPTIPSLPSNQLNIFTIDDKNTTEFDDGLSVQYLDNLIRVGVHISAPSIGFDKNSAIFPILTSKHSTAYFPTGKSTLLPDNWIDQFSLIANKKTPALSLYIDFNVDFKNQLTISQTETKLEIITVNKNLSLQELNNYLTNDIDFAEKNDINLLYDLAIALQKKRNKYNPSNTPKFDYQIKVDQENKVSIKPRLRGDKIDVLVSEMMILANSIWAKKLFDQKLSGIFRVKTGFKPSFSSQVAGHSGIGADYYGWFTSPLRRSADFINQAQLLSIINQSPPVFADNEQIAYLVRDFESVYSNCTKTQKQLENYWTLIYLQQQKINQLTATVTKETTATADDLPLTIKIADLPNQITQNSKVLLKISELEPEKEKITAQFVQLIN